MHWARLVGSEELEDPGDREWERGFRSNLILGSEWTQSWKEFQNSWTQTPVLCLPLIHVLTTSLGNMVTRSMRREERMWEDLKPHSSHLSPGIGRETMSSDPCVSDSFVIQAPIVFSFTKPVAGEAYSPRCIDGHIVLDWIRKLSRRINQIWTTRFLNNSKHPMMAYFWCFGLQFHL